MTVRDVTGYHVRYMDTGDLVLDFKWDTRDLARRAAVEYADDHPGVGVAYYAVLPDGSEVVMGAVLPE